jgi:hypothetical protein
MENIHGCGGPQQHEEVAKWLRNSIATRLLMFLKE